MGGNLSPKVAAGGAAGAVTILLVWAVQTFGGITIPAEVSSAFTTLLSFVVGYATPHNPTPQE